MNKLNTTINGNKIDLTKDTGRGRVAIIMAIYSNDIDINNISDSDRKSLRIAYFVAVKDFKEAHCSNAINRTINLLRGDFDTYQTPEKKHNSK